MPNIETETRPRSPRGRSLLVLCGAAATEHALPAEGVVVIGRGRDANIVVDHPTLSRAHAKLTLGAHMTISDLGSRNGTLVGDRKLGPTEVVMVVPGAPIELGDALLLVRAGDGHGELLVGTTSGGVDDAARSIERTMRRIADSDVAVVFAGEAGVGKLFLAERVHASSARAAEAMVVLSCAPETTAAEVTRALYEAHGGSLVLREPSLLAPAGQAALLRGLSTAGSNVRAITTTARDLYAASAKGDLDAALFHRLAGISVVVAPLRARLGELGALADQILANLAAAEGRPRLLLSADAIASLVRHTWPGNVRELRNALSRALLLARGRVLTAAHFDLDGREHGAAVRGGSLSSVVDEAEHRRILEALRQANGNQTRAAKALGISRGTLISRLERFGVPRPRK